MIIKNRKRKKPTFANINLLGECNANCYFCLGKDIREELHGKNQLEVSYTKWRNFKKFLQLCEDNQINKLYLTGQTADGLQYKYLDFVIDHLQTNWNFKVGVRTNGYLATKKISSINKMKGEIGYSIHSLNPETNYKIMGTHIIPNWDWIIPRSGKNVRISMVLNRYNRDEFFRLIQYISKFKNVRYVQIRRISTDTRYQELKEDIQIYEEFYNEFKKIYPSYGTFYAAQQHKIMGKEVNFWRTVETEVNSFNYFTDGTISDEYFIVEGYLKNKYEIK